MTPFYTDDVVKLYRNSTSMISIRRICRTRLTRNHDRQNDDRHIFTYTCSPFLTQYLYLYAHTHTQVKLHVTYVGRPCLIARPTVLTIVLGKLPIIMYLLYLIYIANKNLPVLRQIASKGYANHAKIKPSHNSDLSEVFQSKSSRAIMSSRVASTFVTKITA